MIEAVLKTKEMFTENDKEDADYPLWQKIAEYMDGEKALLIKSGEEKGRYLFLCLTDTKKNKELFYMMEQDSMTGVFIDDREGFDNAWDYEEYEKDGLFYLDEKYLELVEN